MGAGGYTTNQLINGMRLMRDQVRVYIICNAYEMHNEENPNYQKVKWYINVGYDLMEDKMELSKDEQEEFVNMHFKYLEILKNKYKSFEDLPIHGILDRHDLLSKLSLN